MPAPAPNYGRWIRLYEQSLNHPKIIKLSDKQYRFWTHCLLLAGEDGCLPPIADIAIFMRLSPKLVGKMLGELHAAGLLETDDGETFWPHNWMARQFRDATGAERMKRYRDRKRDGKSDANNRNSPRNSSASASETVSVSEILSSRDSKIQDRESRPLAVIEGGRS